MKKLLFATTNESKVKRFKKQLSEQGIDIISINDIDEKIDVEENGINAIDNALIKARAYASIYNYPIMAMDDSLFIENIPDNKQPGMFVRRVNGKRLSDEEMIEHYSNLAHTYGDYGKLTCRWIYGMAIICNGTEKTYTWSKEDFYIIDTPSDKINPGYPLNSISINKKLNKYFTDITDEDKELIKEDEHEVIDFIVKSINI